MTMTPVSLTCMFVALFATAPACSAAADSLPAATRVISVADPASLTDNQYFRAGIEALSRGMNTFSIYLPISGDGDIAGRVNQVNFGLFMAGWSFVAQDALQKDGTTTALLLTYRRSTH